jgi:3-oxoacyl-[acyl-carrier-protein] synthase-3
MATDAVAVLEHGVVLARETWQHFLERLEWPVDEIDRFVCHQVGSRHREAVLSALGIDRNKDYEAFRFLGNTGSVALPLALGLASERGFVQAGQRVALLGIGSGLNCLMMGLDW